MRSFCLALLFFIFNFSLLTFNSGVARAAQTEPLFEPGGRLCSRSNIDYYPDRSNPGCYVQKGGTSTYNVYIPQAGPGQDPNVSQTCFTISQSHTEIQPTNPGYLLVRDNGFTLIDTTKTQWPVDIPNPEDFTHNFMDFLGHPFGDVFILQGNTTTPTRTQTNTVVDQNGALEKLQPLYFQVKDRVDYCQQLTAKNIFDEPVHYSIHNHDDQVLLSQICSAIPGPVRSMGSNWLDTLINWYKTDPEMAEAFHQIRPLSQQDQVAWMVIYMYQYDYPNLAAAPVLSPNILNPQPVVIKLNIAGLTSGVESQQPIDVMLAPSLTPKAARPAGFPVTAANLAAVQAQVITKMETLGYHVPEDCHVPKGEAQPGPPIGQSLLQQVLNAVFGPQPDANIPTAFFGVCTPQDWHQNPTTGDWKCTTTTSAAANVFLLNPEYLKTSCNEQYLESGGSLRKYFPSQLMTQTNTSVPLPSKPVPLLPVFNVGGGNVSSPHGKGAQVDLPTVCRGEVAQAKMAFSGKANRPSGFLDQSLSVQLIYEAKVASDSLLHYLQGVFSSLFH